MPERPDFTFGAKRWDPDSVLSAHPTLRRRSGRRDLQANVPRNLPAISAPERNVAKSIADTGAGALSALMGGDERERVQRASDISDVLSYVNPVEGVERAFLHGFQQLQGGPSAGVADYINLALPAAGLASGPLTRAAGKMVPQGLRDWLAVSRAMPEADDAIAGQFAVKGTPQLAARPRPQVRALPAPPERLPLPAPPPGGTRVPNIGFKPRGGNWYPDTLISVGQTYPRSPEELARRALPTGVATSSDPRDIALREWWSRAVPKYIKNDFGTENDPLLDLARRRLHPDPDMTPENWLNHTNGFIDEDSVEGILFPPNPLGGMPGAGDDMRGEFVAAMPWLVKQPVTDSIYGVDPAAAQHLGFSHVGDEMRNALNFDGALRDLAVRPESLQRMSFPQAAEHVGRINQRRADLAAEANAALANNPAVHVLKEYPDDPKGLRWVELKQPGEDVLSEGWVKDGSGFYDDTTGDYHSVHPALQDALRYEGDAMGHCVGGYCDDVASGRSRIFSLRDAKGQPHVTIETAPRRVDDAILEMMDQEGSALSDNGVPMHDLYGTFLREKGLPTHDIIQIKGKGNRAPIEDYLPHVQDFVRTQGPWGEIGDLRNTGLTKLPDGRFINQQQIDEAVSRLRADSAARLGAKWSPEVDAIVQRDMPGHMMDPDYFSPEGWESVKQYFEGFARGGRVGPSFLAAR